MKYSLPVTGLILEIVFLLLFIISPSLAVLFFLFVPFIGIFFYLIPVLGVTFGFIGIAQFTKHPLEERKGKTSYLVLSIIDAALPFVAAIVLIILFSTDVLVIRFM